jgi:hypothetical protein
LVKAFEERSPLYYEEALDEECSAMRIIDVAALADVQIENLNRLKPYVYAFRLVYYGF